MLGERNQGQREVLYSDFMPEFTVLNHWPKQLYLSTNIKGNKYTEQHPTSFLLFSSFFSSFSSLPSLPPPFFSLLLPSSLFLSSLRFASLLFSYPLLFSSFLFLFSFFLFQRHVRRPIQFIEQHQLLFSFSS